MTDKKRWWPRHWRWLAAVAGLLVLAYAVQTAVDASDTATRSDHRTAIVVRDLARVTHQLKVAEEERAADARKRALGTCASSTDLRSLLTDLEAAFFPIGPQTPRDFRIVQRIEKYTSTNPNCENVPTAP